MNINELKNMLNNGKPEFSVYLLEGEDAFLRERAFCLLKDSLISEPTLNLAVFDGEYDMGDVLSSLSAMPFMSERRMTVIKEFYPLQNSLSSGIKDFINQKQDCSVLVIINENTCETLKKTENICIINCNKADSLTIIKYIKSRCLSDGVDIDDETAKSLCEFCLSDMMRIENERQKLVCAVDKGETITLDVLTENVYKDNEFKIYELTDYIAKKKTDKALETVQEMLSRGETPQRILSAIYNYFRRLLYSAISGKDDKELSKIFGIKEFAVSKLKAQAKAFKIITLKKAVDGLCEADYNFKSGLVEASDQMWLTLFKLLVE